MRTSLVLILSLVLFGCHQQDRELVVVSKDLQPVAGATVSILPGLNGSTTSSAITDSNGIARFGHGNWQEINEHISIKVVHDGQVLFDAVRSYVRGHRLVVSADGS